MQEGLERISLDEEIIENPITQISEVADDIEGLLERGDVLEIIKSGEFTRYIGDDASGRIPALMFWECAKTIRRGLRQDKIPTLNFIATDREGRNSDQIEDFVKEWDRTNKILIITEYIGTGKSLLDLCTELKLAGFELQILALCGSNNIAIDYTSLDIPIIKGTPTAVPSIYKAWRLSGVSKERGKLFSRRLIYEQKLVNAAHSQALVYGRNIARRVLRKISD